MDENPRPAIAAVSLDIWGTLVRSNPEFRAARLRAIGEIFAASDPAEVEAAISSVEDACDTRTEETGVDFGLPERLAEIAKTLGVPLPTGAAQGLRESLVRLAAEHPPALIESNLPQTLESLRASGVKISLLSNTGFLDGETMRGVLGSLGILERVDAAFFSNEIGAAKPSPECFRAVAVALGVAPESVLHVGDSRRADYHGAWRAGSQSVLFDPGSKAGGSLTSVVALAELPALVAAGAPLHRRCLGLSSLVVDSDRLLDESGEPFDVASYSRFKYGDGEVAKRYGHRLAAKFIAAYPELVSGPDADTGLAVTTSPYKAIPKGSSGIVTGFVAYLNRHLALAGKDPVASVGILKSTMFEGDYGTLSDRERQRLITESDYFVSERFVRGRRLIVIDDVRITGSHERHLSEFFGGKGLAEAIFLYAGIMDFAYAKARPQIESEMNGAWMDGLGKLLELTKSPEFLFNARVCKYVLSGEDRAATAAFFAEVPGRVLYDFFAGAIGDGYASMPAYAASFALLEAELERRGITRNGQLA